jgi:hypothetical protein
VGTQVPAATIILLVVVVKMKSPAQDMTAAEVELLRVINAVVVSMPLTSSHFPDVGTQRTGTESASGGSPRYSVRGQALWLHWYAISTSYCPASRQASPQYFTPGLTSHVHGMCPHLDFVLVFHFLLSPFSEFVACRPSELLLPVVSACRLLNQEIA